MSKYDKTTRNGTYMLFYATKCMGIRTLLCVHSQKNNKLVYKNNNCIMNLAIHKYTSYECLTRVWSHKVLFIRESKRTYF